MSPPTTGAFFSAPRSASPSDARKNSSIADVRLATHVVLLGTRSGSSSPGRRPPAPAYALRPRALVSSIVSSHAGPARTSCRTIPHAPLQARRTPRACNWWIHLKSDTAIRHHHAALGNVQANDVAGLALVTLTRLGRWPARFDAALWPPSSGNDAHGKTARHKSRICFMTTPLCTAPESRTPPTATKCDASAGRSAGYGRRLPPAGPCRRGAPADSVTPTLARRLVVRQRPTTRGPGTP